MVWDFDSLTCLRQGSSAKNDSASDARDILRILKDIRVPNQTIDHRASKVNADRLGHQVSLV